jgi:hypothetical protein
MGIRIVRITPDRDAKRRKKTISRIKGTPSEIARDKKALKALEESYKHYTDSDYEDGLILHDGGIARKTRRF